MTWVHTNDLSKRSEQVTRAWEAEKKKKLGQNLQRYADMGVPIASIGQNCFTRFNTTLSETVIWSWADHSSPQPLRNVDLRGEVASVKATALGYRGVQHEESPSLSSYSEEEEDPVQIAQGVKRRAKSPPFAPPAKRFQVILEESDSDSMGTSRPPSRRSKGRPRRNEASLRLRRRVETAWNRIARNSGAATISLVNDVDDEEIPSSIDPATFTYLERSSYILPEGETSHSGLYEGCECEDGCISPDECACQSTEFADVIMHHGRRSFAYDRNGLYIFPEQFDFAVFECNHMCRCSHETCPNRVAQRPRDVPLEIFKTVDCGWGVRAPIAVPRGKVIGVFTGELSQSADDDYTYHLDWFDPNNRWRVTSRRYGNWSRFLNHSCYPNLKAYGVIYDSIPDADDDQRHRLAFVALRDIAKYEELTIDYAPKMRRGGQKDGCCEFGGCKRPGLKGRSTREQARTRREAAFGSIGGQTSS